MSYIFCRIGLKHFLSVYQVAWNDSPDLAAGVATASKLLREGGELAWHAIYWRTSKGASRVLTSQDSGRTGAFGTVVLEKTLESPLDCKEIQPVHPKGNQSWVFIGRSDVEAETPIFWPPDVKSWLIWKDPDAGKDWGQEKGMTEDEMIGWHHWLDGHEFW